ncbi:ferric reductase like transmembrane component-domain-containing protein [Xylogone sp. PMI_703]|nr:ferric reductase like transmembrane component-domain-containing protein [Xylogone sp. PMI_703]
MALPVTSASAHLLVTKTRTARDFVGTVNSTAIFYTTNHIDYLVANYLAISLGAFTFALLVGRVGILVHKRVRTSLARRNESQQYFARTSRAVSWLKKNVLYAPIGKKQHNREIQLRSGVNIGSLPTRMQFAWIVGYILTNVVCCVVDIFWDLKPEFVFYDMIRNRCGSLAVFNLVPLFLTAGRNNPFIYLLGVSFDTFNLAHKWIGRIVVLEVIVHAVLFYIADGDLVGYHVAANDVWHMTYLTCGFIAFCCFVLIVIQSLSMLRYSFYEAFKLIHIVLAAVAIGAVYYHLKLQKYWELVYLYPIIALWAFDHAARGLRLVYTNFGAGGTRALVETLPGNSCRITVTMARPWIALPGQHAYLYMPSIGLWQSHPFCIAWSEKNDKPEESSSDEEKPSTDHRDINSDGKPTVSFIVRARTGFTSSLYAKAAASKDGRLVTRCFAEGPYGAISLMGSYRTAVFFAGGVGITHPLLHVRYLLQQHNCGKAATRRIVLVWSIQELNQFEWARSWIAELLSMENSPELLRVMLFISSQQSIEGVSSPADRVQMFAGRPDIDGLLGVELENQVGACAVSICGPGSLSDEVRRAVRAK